MTALSPDWNVTRSSSPAGASTELQARSVDHVYVLSSPHQCTVSAETNGASAVQTAPASSQRTDFFIENSPFR